MRIAVEERSTYCGNYAFQSTVAILSSVRGATQILPGNMGHCWPAEQRVKECRFKGPKSTGQHELKCCKGEPWLLNYCAGLTFMNSVRQPYHQILFGNNWTKAARRSNIFTIAVKPRFSIVSETDGVIFRYGRHPSLCHAG